LPKVYSRKKTQYSTKLTDPAYNCEFRHTVHTGKAIVQVAKERLADVIVVGKHFGSKPGEGHTVNHVLENAPCDVWIVRLPEPTQEEQAARASALALVIEAEEQERLRRVMEDYGVTAKEQEAAEREASRKDLETAIALEEEERLRRVEMLRENESAVKWTAEPFTAVKAQAEMDRRSMEAEKVGLFSNGDFAQGSA
jgi:hypothetical protein